MKLPGRKMKLLAAGLALLLAGAPRASAHEVVHEEGRQEAVVVRLAYEDGEPFANEAYEVFAPGGAVPFQSGRTDSLGRLLFLPDREGPWRIRAVSEEGHGVEFSVDAAGLSGPPRPPSPWGRWARIGGALALLGFLFWVAARFTRSQRRG